MYCTLDVNVSRALGPHRLSSLHQAATHSVVLDGGHDRLARVTEAKRAFQGCRRGMVTTDNSWCQAEIEAKA